jgi:glycerol-3-phosphate dehydrogenase
VAKLPIVKCKTRKLRLHGAELPAGWDQRFAVYGTDAERIVEMITADPYLGEPLIPGFNYCGAEVVWSVQEEMAMTVEDILARRSRILLLDAQAAIDAAPAVAAIMAPLLGEGQAWIDNQIRLFQDLAAGYQIDLGDC